MEQGAGSDRPFADAQDRPVALFKRGLHEP